MSFKSKSTKNSEEETFCSFSKNLKWFINGNDNLSLRFQMSFFVCHVHIQDRQIFRILNTFHLFVIYIFRFCSLANCRCGLNWKHFTKSRGKCQISCGTSNSVKWEKYSTSMSCCVSWRVFWAFYDSSRSAGESNWITKKSFFHSIHLSSFLKNFEFIK